MLNPAAVQLGLPSPEQLKSYRIWDSYFTPSHSHPGRDGQSRLIADIERSLPAIQKGKFEKLCYFAHVGIGTTPMPELEKTVARSPGNGFETAQALAEAVDRHDPTQRPRCPGFARGFGPLVARWADAGRLLPRRRSRGARLHAPQLSSARRTHRGISGRDHAAHLVQDGRQGRGRDLPRPRSSPNSPPSSRSRNSSAPTPAANGRKASGPCGIPGTSSSKRPASMPPPASSKWPSANWVRNASCSAAICLRARWGPNWAKSSRRKFPKRTNA